MRSFILILLFSLLAVSVSFASDRGAAPSSHEPNVEIWLPPDFRSGHGPWPLVIYSHDFAGCSREADFLMRYMSENGYIMAAPDHRDARFCKNVQTYKGRHDDLTLFPEKPFRNPASWTDETEISRRDDILFTLRSILDDPQFKGYVDEDKIGLIGYSLGGYTALGLAGGWDRWKDPRFKAAAVFSPYVAPYLHHRTLASLRIPILYQGGTRDSNTASIKGAGGAFRQMTSAPAYFIELKDANHLSWTEHDDRFHDIVNETVRAFMDRHLKNADTGIVPAKHRLVSAFWQNGEAEKEKGANP